MSAYFDYRPQMDENVHVTWQLPEGNLAIAF